ncbi:dynein-related subfamily AAA family protein [Pantoea sp. PNA 14-12]|nr:MULTISPECIES: AAA family ATPase [Pantoea]TDS69204.1 dynein-related subfamily AAA family protein [Pantoea sp. PNA 14-12]
MSQISLEQLEKLNLFWNECSDFKVFFLGTGSFFEVTNSSGKTHDVSFQCILQSLIDISKSNKAKQFINYSIQQPSKITNIQALDQKIFDDIIETEAAECTEWKYYEKMVRVLATCVLTYSRARVVASEQTKLFFNIVSRIIHIANNLDPKNLDNYIPFNNEKLSISISYLEQIIDAFSSIACKKNINLHQSFPEKKLNTIFFGAPGTGKSWLIERETINAIKVRTVFYPDMQYSDFVGALKPRMIKINNDKRVGYEFRPGPFTNAYIKSLNNPSDYVYLIIEEINRAPAAAVFGELFQLLDQDDTYEIDIDPDMLDYINDNIENKIEKLFLPPNFTILATMNSSDQGVNLLDTAFKRRWSIKYMPIDYNNATPGMFLIPVTDATCEISWANFSKIINEKLTNLGIPEDRLLGHRFISINEISSKTAAIDTLRFKIFAYLWDDVLRHGKRQLIFSPEALGEKISNFGNLISAFDAGMPIFNIDVEESICAAGIITLSTNKP